MLRRSFLVAAVALGALGGLPLVAQGSRTPVTPDSTRSPVILAARIENSSLHAVVANATSGTVQLIDRRGTVFATASFGSGEVIAPPDNGKGKAAEAVFSGILPRLLAGSPLYSLRLVPNGSSPPYAIKDWPFAVTLSCTTEFCRPNLQPGVQPGAGTRWADPELSRYFDTAPPGQPVLEGALAAGLIGPALDFGRLVATDPVPAPGACECSFVFEAAPPVRKPCGEGLTIGVDVMGVAGEKRIEALRTHQLELALPLRCFSRWGASTYRILVRSGEWSSLIEAPVPALLPCSRPCSAGQPNFKLMAEGLLELSLKECDEAATADASWQVRVTPGQGLAFGAGDSREVFGNNAELNLPQLVEWSGGASKLDVEVNLKAGVSLPGKHETARAVSTVNLSVVAEASSLCGDVVSGSATLQVTEAKGLAPDLDPTQISILIGGGCRP